MDREDMEEMIRKMLGKPSNTSHSPSYATGTSHSPSYATGTSHSPSYATGGMGNGFGEMNNERLLRENLNSFFLQHMQDKLQQQQQQQPEKSAPEPISSQPAASQSGNTDLKVDLTLPDVESLMKVLIQNVSTKSQDKSALEEEKAKRLALEREAEEMRQKIKAFEVMSQKAEAAAAQKKLDAFESLNAMQSQTQDEESMQALLAKCLADMMLKDSPTKKKVLNDPKWFPGTSKNPEQSNTNFGEDKPMFKDMLKNPLNHGMPQHAYNFMQPGPSGQFHGGPYNYSQPPNLPPYQQNGYQPMPGPHPWPGHGSAPGIRPQQPHQNEAFGPPGPHGYVWRGPAPGQPNYRGPFPGQNLPKQKKQKQPQQQQQQQQNQPKQKQQQQNQQQQNQTKQKQQQQNQQQQNQQQQNQPKQKQVPKTVLPTQEMSKKKKNAQNQEQNKNGAQSKLTVPVGSCVNLSPNSSAQNEEAPNSDGIKLTQDEINELKQSIKMMNEGGTGRTKKRNKKKKSGEEGAANDDDSSGGEGKNNLGKEGMVKNVLYDRGTKMKTIVVQKQEQKQAEAQPVAAAAGEGKKKKKKKNAGGDGSQPNSEFSLYVGDRWPTLADINAGRLKLDQPVKNIQMLAKTPTGDVCSTPKIIQDMLVFNTLYPSAVLVFSSD